MFVVKSPLQQEMDRILKEMSRKDPSTDEYKKLVDRLKDLAGTRKEPTLRLDTVMEVGANLGGILLILNHEKLDVISTKALGFVQKLRF